VPRRARARRRALRRGEGGGALPRALRARARAGRRRLSGDAGSDRGTYRGTYRVATGAAEASRRELGSRFFAFVAPADSLEAAKRFVDATAARFADATHVCFAWRVGWPAAERAADAGEPAGTAGAPILQALRTAELTDTVAAVVRYFGGTKLGKGGLVRAYGDVTREALSALPARRERPRVRLVVCCAYEQIGAVKRLLRADAVELAGESYGERATLVLAVAIEARAALEAALAELRLGATTAD
jgi:uncharacterized YigZ family protein